MQPCILYGDLEILLALLERLAIINACRSQAIYNHGKPCHPDHNVLIYWYIHKHAALHVHIMYQKLTIVVSVFQIYSILGGLYPTDDKSTPAMALFKFFQVYF